MKSILVNDFNLNSAVSDSTYDTHTNKKKVRVKYARDATISIRFTAVYCRERKRVKKNATTIYIYVNVFLWRHLNRNPGEKNTQQQ